MLQKFKDKIKPYENEIFFAALIILLIVAVAGALRLFFLKPEKPPIVIQENAFSVTEIGEKGEPALFIASRNGTKYYPVNCKTGTRIKPENRIYFASAMDAQKAGYERTVSCD